MPELSPEQLLSHRQKQQKARQKQIDKQRDRLADPEWRASQYERQRKTHQRMQTRAIERAKERAANPKPKTAVSRARKSSSRGTKGRTPTADERRVMDALGRLPCIACLMHGKTTEEISLHHIEGRTKPNAHKLVLPLCKWHHQHAAPPEIRALYSWLVPVHADGNVGGKAEFYRLNKPESALLVDAVKLAQIIL
ncbi:Ref family recombination enhancement nuclease [Pantoea septica]|uniref:Ref family recombination enhancement nuclease n=1 Tax=Pantoea septica TaxID=472695 RepID=UPI0023F8FFFD|nr:Ref family recombination enhancement nuclease [Pantoea septica]